MNRCLRNKFMVHESKFWIRQPRQRLNWEPFLCCIQKRKSLNGYTKWVEHDENTVNMDQNDEIIKSKIIFCLGGKAAEALTNGYGKDYILKLLKKQKISSDLKNAIYFAKLIDSNGVENLIGSVSIMVIQYSCSKTSKNRTKSSAFSKRTQSWSNTNQNIWSWSINCWSINWFCFCELILGHIIWPIWYGRVPRQNFGKSGL